MAMKRKRRPLSVECVKVALTEPGELDALRAVAGKADDLLTLIWIERNGGQGNVTEGAAAFAMALDGLDVTRGAKRRA